MDLTNEKKYLNKLFESQEKIKSTVKELNEDNISAKLKDDNTISIKLDENLSTFKAVQIKENILDTIGRDMVSVVFE